MQQSLRIERDFTCSRETFFKILELPFEALHQFFRNLPVSSSLNKTRYRSEDAEEILDNVSCGEKSLAEQIVEDLAFERLDDLTEKIAEYIAYNLDDRGRMLVSIEELCEKFHVEKAVVLRAVEAIKNVGPEGVIEGTVQGFGENSEYVEPDVEITKDYSVIVKEFFLPIPDHGSNFDSRLFVFFQESLSKRTEYLKRIGEIVVETNKDFLVGNRPYPMKTKLTEVAKRLNLTVSAVSKLLKGKYVKTPKSVLPLKIFFGRSVEKEYLLREMFKILSKNSKITDRELAFELVKSGIFLSRRTINKYRNIIREKLNEKKVE